MVLDAFLITDPRMEDNTSLDLKSSISCIYNEQVGRNCVPELYLSTTLLRTVPCILCRHVLVAVTTERSSVPATMSPLDGRIITWVLYNVEGEGEWQKEGVLRCTCV